MCCFFLHSTISHSTLLLFSRGDHCHLWKGVMRELLEVGLQRRFVREHADLKKKTRSPLRASVLSEVVGLMQCRSLWPSVMGELVEKYNFKRIEYDSIVSPPSHTPKQEEEEEENWTDDHSPPSRPTRLPLRARRRRYCEPLRVRFVPY